MKSKRINRLLAITMITTMCITPLTGIANAMEPVKQEHTYLTTKDLEDNTPIGTEYTMSDGEMAAYLKANGFATDQMLKDAGYFSNARYKEGVRKAVKVKGGWDIYLKKSDLSLIKSTGVNGTIGILSALITGVGGAVIGVIAGSIVQAMVPDPKGGMIYRIRTKKVTIGVAGEIEQYYCQSVVYQ
ncbi:hypothetical protein [Clostridioides difficile]|uniref:hypothetical protein n=1 Tax=Clostridioides difficile TaxID=1496 RepID=UPI00103306E2|nr:hypothetical protein [Clostridioides difficile]MDF3817607.1 hypothetical protein [Clostridioides difficile]MDM9944090.1 hypothetical protein [Clostridioides difficile]HBF4283309.1 hypothetical protein [Clostridioides difficile]HBF5048834.1 hypothetical protein [Clostridioides difficile]HBF5114727.1 hypothetical protein [Clostridioides difficile]